MTSALLLAADADRVVGPVRFPGAPPAWMVVVLLAGLALLVRWIYRRERQKVSRPWRIVLGGLRLAAVALVALALCRPEREEARVARDKSHLVLVLDTSSSMATRDRHRPEDEQRLLRALWPEGGPEARPGHLEASRGEIAARSLVGDGGAALAALADRFVVHVYGFDEDLRLLASTEPRAAEAAGAADGGGPPATSPEALVQAVRAAKSDGTQTAIGVALEGVAREFAGRDDRRLAGVVLFSDGRDNAEGRRPVDVLAGLGKGAEDLRVAAVALGDPRLAKNVRVDRVLAKDVVLAGDEVVFLAQLRQTGFDDLDGVDVRLEITQVAGPDGVAFPTPRRYVPSEGARGRRSTREIEEGMHRAVRLLPSAKATPASLRAPFPEPGTYDVAVRAVLPKAHAAEDAVVEDDVRVHRLRVVDQTIRVLLVDREMRYETHFLKNVLVREARRAGDPRRVDAQVWVQGFDPDVRQPAGSGTQPLRAFPSTRQEIFAYDVILFGDVRWRQLGATEERSKEILKLLKDWVAEGGGIGFVAGEAENPTQYLDTPLQDLLPVVVRASDRANELGKSVPFRLAPTEIGREHPILSVLQDRPEKVDEIWREHDGWEWYWLYRAKGGLKPGAFALARVWNAPGAEFLDDRGEPCVVFAGMGFGKGRVFFSAIDQISRIRMSVGDAYYGPFWDETIRWLATYRLLGGNKRYKIETDKETYFVGETATIKVSALDADYQPLRTPLLRGLQVEGPDGKPMLAESDAPRPDPDGGLGLYKTTLRLPATGTYRIWVDPPERDGGARAERRIEARFATREDQDKVPDHETLRAVVAATNPPSQAPRLHAPDEVRELLASIPSRTTERVLDRRDEPLWDTPWTLLLVTAILALEWILRKRFQMI